MTVDQNFARRVLYWSAFKLGYRREAMLLRVLCIDADVLAHKLIGAVDLQEKQWARLAKAYHDLSGDPTARAVMVKAIRSIETAAAHSLEQEPHPSGFRQLCFRIAQSILPARLCKEELGDAEEYLSLCHRSRWEVVLKVTSTLFWLSINAA